MLVCGSGSYPKTMDVGDFHGIPNVASDCISGGSCVRRTSNAWLPRDKLGGLRRDNARDGNKEAGKMKDEDEC